MVPTPDQANEDPKQADEVVRKIVVPPVEAESQSDDDRSPGKVDRHEQTLNLEFTVPESAEVIRKLVVPEAVEVEAKSDDDRSPGKVDRTAIVPEAAAVEPADAARKPVVSDDSSLQTLG